MRGLEGTKQGERAATWLLAAALLVPATAQAQWTEQEFRDLPFDLTGSLSNFYDGKVNARERFGETGDRFFQWRNQFPQGNYDAGWRFPERAEDRQHYAGTKPVRSGFALMDRETGEFTTRAQRKMPQDFGPSAMYDQVIDAQEEANEAAGYPTTIYATSRESRAAWREGLDQYQGMPPMTGPGTLADGRTVEGMPSPYWAAVQSQFQPTPQAMGADQLVREKPDRNYEPTAAGYMQLAGVQQQALDQSMLAVDQMPPGTGYESYNQNMGTTVDPGWYQQTFQQQQAYARQHNPRVFDQGVQAAASGGPWSAGAGPAASSAPVLGGQQAGPGAAPSGPAVGGTQHGVSPVDTGAQAGAGAF